MQGSKYAKLAVIAEVSEYFLGASEIPEPGLGKGCRDSCMLVRGEEPFSIYRLTGVNGLFQVPINRAGNQPTLFRNVFDRIP